MIGASGITNARKYVQKARSVARGRSRRDLGDPRAALAAESKNQYNFKNHGFGVSSLVTGLNYAIVVAASRTR